MNEHKVGEIIEGTVIEIRHYGAIMIFEDGATGLLHISEIANAYIKNIFRYLMIGKTYQVKVIEVAEDGFMKVSMNKISDEEKELHHSQAAKKTPVKEEYIDFTALKEHLDEWVKKENEND